MEAEEILEAVVAFVVGALLLSALLDFNTQLLADVVPTVVIVGALLAIGVSIIRNFTA